jgi:hypothetical protein
MVLLCESVIYSERCLNIYVLYVLWDEFIHSLVLESENSSHLMQFSVGH